MNYPCGHPRTPENTQSVGIGNGVRCKECRRRIRRDSAYRRYWEKCGQSEDFAA